MIAFLVPISFALCLTFMVYIFLNARNRERMAVIEKGLEPEMLNFSADSKWMILRLGMLMIAVGLGFFIGFILEEHSHLPPAASQVTLVLIFGGLALIANFFIERKWRK